MTDLTRDPRSRAVLEGIVGLCGSLGLSTSAEGVEARAQFELLGAMGVQEFQGSFFAPPQSQDAWLAALRREGGLAAADACEPSRSSPGRREVVSGR